MTHRGPARTAAPSLASSAAGAPAARHVAPHRRLLAAAELRELQESLVAHATCIRENGVADVRGPGPDETVQYQGDSDRPEFASAGEKCDDLVPPPPGPNR